MFLLRNYLLTPADASSFGELWAIVENSRRKHSDVFASAHLWLLDAQPPKVSASGRLKEAYPSLLPFSSLNQRGPIHTARENGADESTFSLISEVANGVPRQYPSNCCVLTLPWSSSFLPQIPIEMRGEPSPREDPHPSLCGVKVSRQFDENWLAVTIPLVNDALGVPNPPERALTIVRELGTERWTETRCLLDRDDRKAARAAQTQVEPMLKQLQALSRQRPSPPAVRDDKPERNFARCFRRLLELHGYEYRDDLSQRRYHVARKSSPTGNILTLSLDVGGVGRPWMPAIDLEIAALGRYKTSIPILPQRVISGAAHWEAECNSLHEWLGIVERDWLPQIDEALGPSPKWFSTLDHVFS